MRSKQIVIYCGGLPFDGDTIKTSSLGGSETAAYYVAKELAALGHSVTMFTNTKERGRFDGVLYQPLGEINQDHPLGTLYEQYTTSTLHDVLIVQRHPYAFVPAYASKSNYLWLHDVPTGDKSLFRRQMSRIDGVFVVSEYHKKMMVEAYDLDPDFVHNVQNAVDAELYTSDVQNHPDNIGVLLDAEKINLLYSSRPERGLINLVMPGGIMEQLLELGTDHHLNVCYYENKVQSLAEYHDYLVRRCEALPNVTLWPSLTKQALAVLQLRCDIAVYPCEFVETSCITAIEAQHAKLPLLTSRLGALAETTKKGGAILLDLDKSGKVVAKKFVDTLLTLNRNLLDQHSVKQGRAANGRTWDNVAKRMDLTISNDFLNVSRASMARELMRNSDIYALQTLLTPNTTPNNDIVDTVIKELDLYKHINSDDFSNYYKQFYENEAANGVHHEVYDLKGQPRFDYINSLVDEAIAGSGKTAKVLDYGCAHGHYTINLAKRYPDTMFYGVDICEDNIRQAKETAKDMGVENVEFKVGAVNVETEQVNITEDGFDAVLVCEVLEHVRDYQTHIDVLIETLKKGGLFIASTPYGPWESLSFKSSHPFRTHIHHFDYAELKTIFKGFTALRIANIIESDPRQSAKFGSFVTSFVRNEGTDFYADKYNIQHKIALTKGRETLSVCMIVTSSPSTLLATLESILPVADELIIRFDINCDEATMDIAEKFTENNPYLACTFFHGAAVTYTGFDTARNETIARACGDWILWIDADEVLHNPDALVPYLRHNHHQGYAIQQMHYSMQPPGVTQIDKPVRVFRNKKGIKFFGVVHEHPEIGLNKGIPHVIGLPGVTIAHYGYKDDATRKGRFARNMPLMIRDRKLNPQRVIGKYLWIRDLSQTNADELVQTGVISETMRDRCKEGIKLWRWLLKTDHMRYAIEALPFVSELFDCLHNGETKHIKMSLEVGEENPDAVELEGCFGSVKDIEELTNAVLTHYFKKR